MFKDVKSVASICIDAILPLVPSLVAEKNPRYTDYEDRYSLSNIEISSANGILNSVQFKFQAKDRKRISDFEKSEVEVSIVIDSFQKIFKQKVLEAIKETTSALLDDNIDIKWTRGANIPIDPDGQLKSNAEIVSVTYSSSMLKEDAGRVLTMQKPENEKAVASSAS